MSSFDYIPEGLRPVPPPPLDPLAAAKRAELLVQQVEAALNKGLLSYERLARASAEVNNLLCAVGNEWTKVQADVGLFQFKDHLSPHPHGPLASIQAYSILKNVWTSLNNAMAQFEIIRESKFDLEFHTDANGVTTATGKLRA